MKTHRNYNKVLLLLATLAILSAQYLATGYMIFASTTGISDAPATVQVQVQQQQQYDCDTDMDCITKYPDVDGGY